MPIDNQYVLDAVTEEEPILMNKDEFDSVYNLEVQRLLLSHLIDDPDMFVRCQSIVKDEYFDDQLRRAVRFIMNHAAEYKAVPDPILIAAKTGTEIKKLSEYGAQMDQDWFIDEIVQFCRYKGIENLMLQGIDLLQKNAFSVIEQRLKDALTISLVSDLGTSYFGDPKARLHRLMDKSNMIPTGWKTFDDKLYGGFIRGGLNVFCGGSGSGKSLVLQNLALNWALMGYNVIYFSLELSEDLVALRLDSMLTGKSTKEVFQSVDDTSLSIVLKGKKSGSLTIKKMPEGGTTTNDLRAYLKEFQIKSGMKPDAIIIDYLDLMYPNNDRIDVSSLFVKDKYVSEEIRGMMHETNCFGATASQLNRQSVEAAGEFDHSHIAGGISKINTADNVISIHAPGFLKEKGEMEFMFLKTRSSSAVGQKIKMLYDPPSMKISDVQQSDMIETEKPMKIEDLREQMKAATKEPEKVETKPDDEPDSLTKLARLMVQKRKSGDTL